MGTKQPIMPTEDRLLYRGRVKYAMASRKSINVYFSNCFMAVENCIFFVVIYELNIRLCQPVRISANYVLVGNLNARINPSPYLF